MKTSSFAHEHHHFPPPGASGPLGAKLIPFFSYYHPRCAMVPRSPRGSGQVVWPTCVTPLYSVGGTPLWHLWLTLYVPRKEFRRVQFPAALCTLSHGCSLPFAKGDGVARSTPVRYHCCRHVSQMVIVFFSSYLFVLVFLGRKRMIATPVACLVAHLQRACGTKKYLPMPYYNPSLVIVPVVSRSGHSNASCASQQPSPWVLWVSLYHWRVVVLVRHPHPLTKRSHHNSRLVFVVKGQNGLRRHSMPC